MEQLVLHPVQLENGRTLIVVLEYARLVMINVYPAVKRLLTARVVMQAITIILKDLLVNFVM